MPGEHRFSPAGALWGEGDGGCFCAETQTSTQGSLEPVHSGQKVGEPGTRPRRQSTRPAHTLEGQLQAGTGRRRPRLDEAGGAPRETPHVERDSCAGPGVHPRDQTETGSSYWAGHFKVVTMLDFTLCVLYRARAKEILKWGFSRTGAPPAPPPGRPSSWCVTAPKHCFQSRTCAAGRKSPPQAPGHAGPRTRKCRHQAAGCCPASKPMGARAPCALLGPAGPPSAGTSPRPAGLSRPGRCFSVGAERHPPRHSRRGASGRPGAAPSPGPPWLRPAPATPPRGGSECWGKAPLLGGEPAPRASAQTAGTRQGAACAPAPGRPGARRGCLVSSPSPF